MKWENRKITRIKRKEEVVYIYFGEEYLLRIRGSFRILKKNRILLGSYDIFAHKHGKLWKDEDTDWNISGDSVFDSRISKLQRKLSKYPVKRIIISAQNDLTVCLDRGYYIEIL